MIDPSVEPDVYVSLARERGVQIRAVLDTRAQLFLLSQDRVRYDHKPLAGTDTVKFGASALNVVSTPVVQAGYGLFYPQEAHRRFTLIR